MWEQCLKTRGARAKDSDCWGMAPMIQLAADYFGSPVAVLQQTTVQDPWSDRAGLIAMPFNHAVYDRHASHN